MTATTFSLGSRTEDRMVRVAGALAGLATLALLLAVLVVGWDAPSRGGTSIPGPSPEPSPVRVTVAIPSAAPVAAPVVAPISTPVASQAAPQRADPPLSLR